MATDPDSLAHPPDPVLGSAEERRDHWACTGQVEPLLDELLALDWTLLDPEDQYQRLEEALIVRAQTDPAGTADLLIARLIAFQAGLVFRQQRAIDRRLRQYGRATQSYGPPDVPPEVIDQALPHLHSVQRHVLTLFESQARLARLRQLTARAAAPAQRRRSTPTANVNGHRLENGQALPPSRASSTGSNGHPRRPV